MSQKTEIITALSTVACAFGIGFVMQSGEVAELRYGTALMPENQSIAVVGKPLQAGFSPDLIVTPKSEIFDVQAIELTSANITAKLAAPRDAGLAETPRRSPHDLSPVARKKAQDCPLSADATPRGAAMIEFSLNAPCLAGSPFVVSHNGLTFGGVLPQSGAVTLALPALSQAAQVSASFASGEVVTAQTRVDSVPFYDRVVVTWQGDAGIQVHAREFGARYGDDGHVWAGAARDISAIVDGTGGFLTTLGEGTGPDTDFAEVYTFPTRISKAQGLVDLTIETEVTRRNCGQEIKAHTLQFTAGKRVSAQDLSLVVPDCDALGHFLVLNNLLQDLTVASK